MRLKRSNAAILALGLALIPLAAQAPTGASEPGSAPAVSQSQPGARGQMVAMIQPPVPVPPGPVPASEIKPAPPTPIAMKKVELGSDETWDPSWDVLIEENLPQELLSSDVARYVKPFCPRFNALSDADKRAFWAYLFQALAGAEAGLKPTANVRHTDPEVAVTDTVTHRIVRQQGLLQLTYMDADRYGCDFDWDADKKLDEHDPDKTILQPKNNLVCGLRIMKNQLIDLHQPLLTAKSYWSTLRPGTLSYQVFAKQMTNVPAACVVHPKGAPKRQAPAIREASAEVPSAQSSSTPANTATASR